MGKLALEIEQGIYLGIDFGTTNSVVSVYDYDLGDVYTVPIDGQMIFPTVIQLERDPNEAGKLIGIFGIEAKEGGIIYPESTVVSIKRALGKDQPITVVVEEVEYDFKPEDMVTQILRHLRKEARKYMKEEKNVTGAFSGCIITVPANSTDKQRSRMRQAAIGAGFVEDRIYLRLEPAAAAIHYAETGGKDSVVLVYDFGGGTFDACLLKLAHMEAVEPEIAILSTYGDNYLGGNDLDRLMVDMIYDAFLQATEGKIDLFDLTKEDGVSKEEKQIAIVRLYQAANQAKEKLSTTHSAKIFLAPFLQEPEIVNLNLDISREAYYHHKRQRLLDESEEDFALMKGTTVKELVGRTLECVQQCLTAANLQNSMVDDIVLVGGSSAVPLVKEEIAAFFDQPVHQGIISPALSISRGAAWYCHRIMMPGGGISILEKTLHPLGLEIAGRRFLEVVEAGKTIPPENLVVEATELLRTNFDGITKMAITVYEDTQPSEEKQRLKFVYETGMKRLAGTTLEGIPAKSKGAETVKVIFTINQDNLLTVTATSTSEEGATTQLSVDDLYR